MGLGVNKKFGRICSMPCDANTVKWEFEKLNHPIKIRDGKLLFLLEFCLSQIRSNLIHTGIFHCYASM